MKTLAEFKASLNAAASYPAWTAPLKALWYDVKGDWQQAHAQVDHLEHFEAQGTSKQTQKFKVERKQKKRIIICN